MCFFLCQNALGKSEQTESTIFPEKQQFLIEAIYQKVVQKIFLYITSCLRKLRCLVLAEMQFMDR
jgi:hypothetical protein